MYNYVKIMYERHVFTSEQVWAYADKGTITATQALRICGPRPSKEG